MSRIVVRWGRKKDSGYALVGLQPVVDVGDEQLYKRNAAEAIDGFKNIGYWPGHKQKQAGAVYAFPLHIPFVGFVPIGFQRVLGIIIGGVGGPGFNDPY